MGCTASKKRTVSVEDLPNAAAAPSSGKNKNGQLTANDSKSTPPIKRETAKTTSSSAPPSDTSAIQIPGAHKSFLAPDGIPFIDEDVEDEDEMTSGRGHGDVQVIGNAVVKPDVNKNVVKGPTPAVGGQQQQPQHPVAQHNVVVDVQKPTVIVAGERRPEQTSTSLHEQQQQREEEQRKEEEEKERAVALDILSRELDVFSSHNETTTTVSVSEQHTEPPRPITEEEQQKAAVKIQAGIRGYRDRQKVKAIRAAHQEQPQTEGHDEVMEEAPVVTVDAKSQETWIKQDDDLDAAGAEHDAENDAALKIQARYKGFKARQQVKTMKEQSAHVVTDENDVDPAHVSVECSDHDALQSDDNDDDPEKQRAAVKIQASYKGWKTRKQMGKVK